LILLRISLIAIFLDLLILNFLLILQMFDFLQINFDLDLMVLLEPRLVSVTIASWFPCCRWLFWPPRFPVLCWSRIVPPCLCPSGSSYDAFLNPCISPSNFRSRFAVVGSPSSWIRRPVQVRFVVFLLSPLYLSFKLLFYYFKYHYDFYNTIIIFLILKILTIIFFIN